MTRRTRTRAVTGENPDRERRTLESGHKPRSSRAETRPDSAPENALIPPSEQDAAFLSKSPSNARRDQLLIHLQHTRGNEYVQRILQRKPKDGEQGNAEPVEELAVAKSGKKYDDVKEKLKTDSGNNNFEFSSVSEEDLEQATIELAGDLLKTLPYRGEKQALIPPIRTVNIGKNWVAPEGYIGLPDFVPACTQILSGEFPANLAHELGHMVKGAKGSKGSIRKIIKKYMDNAVREAKSSVGIEANAKPEAWAEEIRADLAGVYLRWMRDKKAPSLNDYSTFKEEAADTEHPTGDFRYQKITEFIQEVKEKLGLDNEPTESDVSSQEEI